MKEAIKVKKQNNLEACWGIYSVGILIRGCEPLRLSYDPLTAQSSVPNTQSHGTNTLPGLLETQTGNKMDLNFAIFSFCPPSKRCSWARGAQKWGLGEEEGWGNTSRIMNYCRADDNNSGSYWRCNTYDYLNTLWLSEFIQIPVFKAHYDVLSKNDYLHLANE